MDSMEILKQALENNDEDRQKANEIVVEIMKYIQSNQDRFVTAGPVLGKHIDALIKNNEQLIRLGMELQKINPVMSEEDELEESDLNNVFDNIQSRNN